MSTSWDNAKPQIFNSQHSCTGMYTKKSQTWLPFHGTSTIITWCQLLIWRCNANFFINFIKPLLKVAFRTHMIATSIHDTSKALYVCSSKCEQKLWNLQDSLSRPVFCTVNAHLHRNYELANIYMLLLCINVAQLRSFMFQNVLFNVHYGNSTYHQWGMDNMQIFPHLLCPATNHIHI